jgi:purine-nucleoside phosphorylase
MSTVTEVIVAVHGGMRVLGLSVITNVHNPESPESITVEDVIASANEASPRLNHIVGRVIENISNGKLP